MLISCFLCSFRGGKQIHDFEGCYYSDPLMYIYLSPAYVYKVGPKALCQHLFGEIRAFGELSYALVVCGLCHDKNSCTTYSQSQPSEM